MVLFLINGNAPARRCATLARAESNMGASERSEQWRTLCRVAESTTPPPESPHKKASFRFTFLQADFLYPPGIVKAASQPLVAANPAYRAATRCTLCAACGYRTGASGRTRRTPFPPCNGKQAYFSANQKHYRRAGKKYFLSRQLFGGGRHLTICIGNKSRKG